MDCTEAICATAQRLKQGKCFSGAVAPRMAKTVQECVKSHMNMTLNAEKPAVVYSEAIR